MISETQSSVQPNDIVAAFLDCAARDPSRIAVRDGDRTTTYGELARAVTSLASAMARDLPDGALIALLLPVNADLVSASLAALAAGHPYLPVDARAPPMRIAQVLGHAGAAAVVLSRETESLVPAWEPNVVRILIDDPAAVGPADVALREERSFAGRIASIHYTSGSTGQPKGVIRLRPQVAAMIARLVAEFGLTEQDRVMIGQSSATAAWHETMLSVLTCGAQFSIDPFREGLGAALDRLRRERTTVLRCTATMLRTLTGAMMTSADTLRLVTVGSEWLFSADLVPFRERFPRHTRLLSIAGTTECGWISRWFIDPWLEFRCHALPAGYVVSGVSISLVDPDGRGVAAADAGQLIVAGPTVSCGYWRDPQATRLAFAPLTGNPAVTGFRTGDTARLRPDGMLELLGRNDRMVKINGTLVSLPEIEGVIRGCADVADVAIVARKTGDAVKLVGYLVPATAEHSRSLPDRVRERISLDLPASMQPAELHCMGALPQLESGKVDLITLERIDREQIASASSTHEPSRDGAAFSDLMKGSDVYQAVRMAWTRVLSEESFKMDARWDQAGGDSLKAMELLLSIESHLGRSVAAELFAPEISPSALIESLRRCIEASPGATIGDKAAPRASEGLWPLPRDLRVRLLATFATWTGERPTSSRMVIGHHMTGRKPPIFWVFNAETEPPHFARVLGPDQPLYAFRSGFGVSDCAENDIQAFALRYISEIEEICPDGPVFIGGNCNGVEFAVAIAQHALRRKRHVPLLILMDWSSELHPYAGRILCISGKNDIYRNARRRFTMPELAWHKTFADFEFFEITGSNAFDESSIEEVGRVVTSRLRSALSAPTAVMPSGAYRATILAEGIKPRMRPGQRRAIKVTVRNDSGLAWRDGRESAFLVGSRWTDSDGDLVLTGEAKSPVPEIQPGLWATVELALSAPTAAGDYRLHIDVCEEGNRWFNADPSKAHTTSIAVRGSSPVMVPGRLPDRDVKRRPERFLFDSSSQPLGLLLFGWSVPENWGTWSIGPQAKLRLPLSGFEGAWRVTITARAFGRADTWVPVAVRVGDRRLEWVMPTHVDVQNQIDIDCSGDDVILQFSLPEAMSPLELGLGPDRRKLGLGLIGMEFAKVPR